MKRPLANSSRRWGKPNLHVLGPAEVDRDGERRIMCGRVGED
ncbi:MAG: hypothetical protein O9253_02540 [Aquidulcibacter sp.]|nr:hypothetical protein [Aquidulcibacter sp.]